MIGSTIHKILYGAAGIVALAHVVFAAVEAGHSLYYPIPVEMVNTKGDPFMSFQLEENPKFPLAIVHTIICGFILIYYCAHLLIRRKRPDSILVCTGMDFAMNGLGLLAGTVLQWIYCPFPTIWTWLGLACWVLQLLLFFGITVFEVLFIVKKRNATENLTNGSLLRTSVDTLDGQLQPTTYEDVERRYRDIEVDGLMNQAAPMATSGTYPLPGENPEADSAEKPLLNKDE